MEKPGTPELSWYPLSNVETEKIFYCFYCSPFFIKFYRKNKMEK